MSPDSSHRSLQRTHVFALYQSLDQAIREQHQFDERSLLGSMHARLGQYGLHVAREADQVLRLLRDGAPINGVKRIEYGDGLDHLESPLLTALVDGRDSISRLLLQLGAYVDAPVAIQYPDGTGFAHTPLHMLVVRRDSVGARLLIDHGADINRQTTLGTTPLSYAAETDNAPMVEMLLRMGADPAQRSRVTKKRGPCLSPRSLRRNELPRQPRTSGMSGSARGYT